MKLFLFVALVAVINVAARREGGKGHGQGQGHHHVPPPPPFLEGLDDEAVKEFFDIKRNETLTIAEQKVAVLAWAEQHGIQDQVVEFEEKRKQHGEELKNNVTELIAQLPVVLEEFSQLMEYEDATRRQQIEHLRELEAQQPEVYAVLRAAFHQFKPKRGGHRPNRPNSTGPFGPFRPQGGFPPYRE
ncbi:hypothetical protein Q1695_016055 [Nippostrongylus brasiliensis]|nr:hypothetical protein Q1695_016055 [Nippostrongylus brasiliensis]